jgi:hypothetical protein
MLARLAPSLVLAVAFVLASLTSPSAALAAPKGAQRRQAAAGAGPSRRATHAPAPQKQSRRGDKSPEKSPSRAADTAADKTADRTVEKDQGQSQAHDGGDADAAADDAAGPATPGGKRPAKSQV